METDIKHSRQVWLWRALVAGFVLAAIIDLIDGYWPKTLSSVALAGAFRLLAFEIPRRQSGGWADCLRADRRSRCGL